MPQSTLGMSPHRARMNGLAGRAVLILITACALSAPLAAQSGPVLRDCNQHQYEPETLVSLVELFGKEIIQLVDSDAELGRLVQQGTGQDLTNQIYSARLLQRVPDCTEPVIHVQTGNQVPGSAGRAASGTIGITIVVKAMPKPHCEAMKGSQQFQRPFAVRFEPPGNTSNWRLGTCASNPILGILTLGRTLPQPNTAYLFFPVQSSIVRREGLICNDPSIQSQYDPSHPQYHQYGINERIETLICTSITPKCNRDLVFKTMLEEARFIAPTDDGNPVTECKKTRVDIGPLSDNYIKTTINRTEKIIVNYTLEQHFLHPGRIVRQVLEQDNKVYVKTTGEGTGRWPEINEFFAPSVWLNVDKRLQFRLQFPDLYRKYNPER